MIIMNINAEFFPSSFFFLLLLLLFLYAICMLAIIRAVSLRLRGTRYKTKMKQGFPNVLLFSGDVSFLCTQKKLST
jgi:hypothetical protein